MISLLCKWQLKDTKCCRRCPCITRLVSIGTHTAAESRWPLTLICQNETGVGGDLALCVKSIKHNGKKVIRAISPLPLNHMDKNALMCMGSANRSEQLNQNHWS